jgi:hypothetical protein
MGSKKTTNVTNQTGLGDSQFSQLRQGQNDLQMAGAQGFATTNQNIAGLGFDVRQLGQAQDFGFQGVNQNLAFQSSMLGQQIGQVGQGVQGMAGDLRNLDRTVNDGFNQAGNALNNLSGQVGTVGNDVRQGFATTGADMRQGFTDTNFNINNQFDRSNALAMAGFGGLGEMVGGGFANNQELLAALQQNVMGGQGDLRERLDSTGRRLDNYYAGLAQGQQGIQNQVGNLQGNFTDFNSQYTRDARQAQQSASDIQQGVANASSRIQDTIGRTSSAADQTANRILNAVTGQTPTASGTTGGVAGDPNSAPAQQQQIFASKLSEIRSLLQQYGNQLDPAMQQTYTDLATSFDQNGNLVSRGLDAQGNTVMRQMDQNMNLMLAVYGPDGQMAANRSFNVGQAITLAEQFKATLMPQNVATGGFVEPVAF